MHEVTLISGDGIGPEISEAMQRVVAAAGIDIMWDVQPAGAAVIEQEATPLPARVIDSIRRTHVAIKGPVATPVGTGFRSINVALRKEFDLFTNLRPVRSFPRASKTSFPPVDLVIFRENTEDLYAGIEFEMGSADTAQLRELVAKLGAGTIRADAGISIKPISEFGTRRIMQAAFEYAIANGRRKVTCVHKANIMKHSDGLFLRVAREVAASYAQHDVIFDDVIVDAACMQLVLNPSRFDVLVLPNLYGDIVSDLCAGLVGGLGLAPGANIGTHEAIFEAVHGSAPDIAGKNIANPTAVILSAAMMCRHLGEDGVAGAIEQAVAVTLERGDVLTADLGGEATTSEFADALIRALDF